jgi:hypothetical protein
MKKINTTKQRIKSKKNIHFLIMLSIITCILIKSNIVRAGIQDSTLEREKIDGIYAVAPLSDKTHLYNLEIYKMNNKVSYCIQIGQAISTNIYNSTDDTNKQATVTNLNQNQLNYIKEIAYFGYGYKNQTDYKYYMASQELIWEYLNKIDITWTNTLDINGPKIDIESYKKTITNHIKKSQDILGIESQLNCKIGDKLTLIDTNNVLEYFDISNSGKQQVTIKNNTMIINVNENYIGEDKIYIKRKEEYSNLATIHYSDNSQTILSVGNLNTFRRVIFLTIKGETLTTNLVDKDTMTSTPSGQSTLAGAEYELYDENKKLITTFKTDDTLTNKIENLYHKKYYIKQIKASKGYKLNENLIEFDLTNTNNKLTLTEEVIKSTVEINKLYELGNNYERENNIKFNIYDNNKNLYTSLTTTKYGTDSITLPYGSYTIEQDNTTYGYDKVKNIDLTIDENSNTTIRYDLVDKKILNKIHITTKNKLTNEKILEKNIKYKIKEKTNNKYLTYIDNDNNQIEEFSTNDSGELIIPIKLPYGEYQLEQVSTPTNYLENKKLINITINDKSEYTYINNQVLINVDFFNKPILGKLTIITNKEIFKTEDNNYKKEKDIRPNIEVELYYNDNLLNNYKTDESGKIEIENLNLGKYCIKEKNNNNQKCVELTGKDNKTKTVFKEVELTEILKTTNVILVNKDEIGNLIKGTTIELLKDNKVINTSMTNEDGIIKVNNLAKGQYCFKETKISSLNYLLNNEKLCFQITDTSKNIELTIINKLNEEKTIKVPNTLKNSKSYFFIVVICISIIGVIYYKKNHNNTNN